MVVYKLLKVLMMTQQGKTKVGSKVLPFKLHLLLVRKNSPQKVPKTLVFKVVVYQLLKVITMTQSVVLLA